MACPGKAMNFESHNRSKESHKEPPADFETAITQCGFGRFNILLILITFPAFMALVIETGVISYILPSAECDLDLSLMDKGILNAITFCGMIVSAIAWGYLADTRGRKRLLVWCFLANVICVICAAMSQNTLQLMIAKFFAGLIICGPYSVLVSYISEFHGSTHRPRILMVAGVMYATASMLLPLLALVILPRDWNFSVGNMNFTAWKIYLAVCGIPSLLGGILLIFFPETPRFLMTQGRSDEALEVFKTMYSINTGKPKETFPIKDLVNDKSIMNEDIKKTKNSVTMETMKSIDLESQSESSSPLRILFSKTYFWLTIRLFSFNFFILLGQNTMRLWLPQLFASLNEYQQISEEKTSMCTILEYSVNKTDSLINLENECNVVITPSTYSNNIVVAGIMFVGFLVAGTLINILGDKNMQIITATICGTCGLALYWSSSTLTTLIITSLYMSMASIATSSSVTTSVTVFPTTSRTIIVSSSMTCGRVGTILGNLLFPMLMSLGCVPPIIMLAGVMYFTSLLACTMPNIKRIQLK
ncbi:uncharacterized protein LOC142231187 [Haematobia irritans]|uniref:uncharacterized protein LOC142231187 n=1 Tax=Haematobia irritans TaxID=7368 RepID=UPI003F4FEA1A